MRSPITITENQKAEMIKALQALNIKCTYHFTAIPGEYPARVGEKPETFIAECMKIIFPKPITHDEHRTIARTFNIWDWDDNNLYLITRSLNPRS